MVGKGLCVAGLAMVVGCSGAPGTGVNLDAIDYVVFQDEASDFATSDVRDVDGEIVRFDAANGRLIWVADALAFDGWVINSNRLQGGFFTVRFGSEGGTQRAYFTETNPPTICDIFITDGTLRIVATDTPVPQN